jgi:haloalkane dehalogenase
MALDKHRIDVLDRTMAYIDTGAGDPIVFLHGNPTSSYLWRNIWPHVEAHGRCLAPDLIGMGDSDKLPDPGPDRYTLFEHRRYLDAWFDALGLDTAVTLVIHDWGSALGFDWARRHPDAIRGIAYMEALVTPLRWQDWSPQVTQLFQALRSPAGEQLVLDDNTFVEAVLPASILRTLDDAELAEYRRPFAEPGEGRRPTLTWPRQIPFDGEPADVHAVVDDYGHWLTRTPIPKLFINAEPGAILTGRQRDLCRTFPNQTEITVDGIHFLQEDSPDDIGHALATWLDTLPIPTAASDRPA